MRCRTLRFTRIVASLLPPLQAISAHRGGMFHAYFFGELLLALYLSLRIGKYDYDICGEQGA